MFIEYDTLGLGKQLSENHAMYKHQTYYAAKDPYIPMIALS